MLHKPVGCDIEQVVELIDSSSRSWIPQVLHTIFPPVVVEKILCIPLSRYLMLDKLTWKLEKKGFFSVKSAYWIARDIVLDNIAASSSLGDPYNLLWKVLWNSKIPGKNRNDMLWSNRSQTAMVITLSSMSWYDDFTMPIFLQN
ncbi:hypothetical protein M0R45_006640 [Rubus argutus]|uniref:Reverse transcriptase n=1 Tax=Rubus argutus TaxID=59490 RepID=A0AAW1YR55_RUBAR